MVRGPLGTRAWATMITSSRCPALGQVLARSVKVASTLLKSETSNGKHTVDTQDTPITQRPRVRTCKDLLCFSPRGKGGKEDRQLSFPGAGPRGDLGKKGFWAGEVLSPGLFQQPPRVLLPRSL